MLTEKEYRYLTYFLTSLPLIFLFFPGKIEGVFKKMFLLMENNSKQLENIFLIIVLIGTIFLSMLCIKVYIYE